MSKSFCILTTAAFITITTAVWAGEPARNTLKEKVNEDPWESFNRPIFNFNLVVDRNVIRPVAMAYHGLPGFVRYGVGNELTNLSEPLNALHGILQLNPKIFFTSFWRFTLNSTLGLGGLRDFAGENGLHNTNQDMGKTLGRWGICSGPYVVLPVLGPSSVRDTVGKVADYFDDPVDFYITVPEQIGIGVADGIATRDRQTKVIDEFYYHSLDPYVASRSAYLQNEAFEASRHDKAAERPDPRLYPELHVDSQESGRQLRDIEKQMKKGN